ncbi:hypothetical protein [Nocardia harenae]|uniref:hypothetical protein n=1 Tax=Nocardia harenae TaxID=358707 RepID=UPI000835337A|nr:hypothetical protein [Nocardia harenae]
MSYISTDVDGHDGLEVQYRPERLHAHHGDFGSSLIPASVVVDLVGVGVRSYVSLSITDARFLLGELAKVLAEHDAAESAQTDTTVDAVDAGKAA